MVEKIALAMTFTSTHTVFDTVLTADEKLYKSFEYGVQHYNIPLDIIVLGLFAEHILGLLNCLLNFVSM